MENFAPKKQTTISPAKVAAIEMKMSLSVIIARGKRILSTEKRFMFLLLDAAKVLELTNYMYMYIVHDTRI